AAAVVATLLWRPVVAGLFRPGFARGPEPVVLPSDTQPAIAPPADTAPLTPLPPGRVARSQPPRPAATAPSTSTPTRRDRTRTATPAPATPRRAETPQGQPAAQPQPETAAAAPAAPVAEGRLFVNSTPWGQLFLDGRPMGNTPKANLAVPAGSHTIRVVREGFQPYEGSVEVSPGQVVRLTGIVLTARQP
ncbi:MAG TPA: PEGA domain-containing protein, partial [Frankiaceae bacterium]|nr:PEGA domain-containing protein [Frankiaceae bacterium]